MDSPGSASDLPSAFCLHALGSSAQEFAGLSRRLSSDFDVVAIDLPGFGEEAANSSWTVEAMADHVLARISQTGSPQWILVGHSMGGKVATVVASRVLSGEAPVFGLAGIVLLAASPTVPEPMDDDRRDEMMGWAAEGGIRPEDARTFIDANVGSPLHPEADALAIADVLRTNGFAWRAWLDRGSREDWSARVGELSVPALIISGGEDGDLGPEAQRELNGATYPSAEFLEVAGAGHLLPWESADEVADAIREFWNRWAGLAPRIEPDVAGVIASARTSARTRGILARRALADNPGYVPRSLSPQQLDTLRAIARRVVPVSEGFDIDLGARVDDQLAHDRGDGWRNHALPPDLEAYRASLDELADFAQLAEESQLQALTTIAAGEYEPRGSGPSAEQLQLWFEDACVDLVRHWLAHPAMLARIGFDGYANGGDGDRKQGFELLGAGQRENWEPRMGAVR